MRLLNLPKRRPIRSDIPLWNRNCTCSSRNSPWERKSLIVLASMNSDTLPNVSSIFSDRQDERSFCTTVIAGITPGCSHARRTYRILKSALNIFLRKLNVRSRRCFTFLFRTYFRPAVVSTFRFLKASLSIRFCVTGNNYCIMSIYLLTYSMVQSTSWEAIWFAASQEIPRILLNPKVQYRTHKRPPPFPILGQPNPVHIPTSQLLEVHPNIIHLSTPRSPQWSLSIRFPHKDSIRPPLLTHTRHIPCQSHSSRFSHPHNIGWGVQIT